MITVKKKGALFAVMAVAALATGTLMASGASSSSGEPNPTDDYFNKSDWNITGTAQPGYLTASECGGNTPPSGTVTCFSVPGSEPFITVFCSNSTAQTKTPAYDPASPGGPGDGDDLARTTIYPTPTFSDGSTSSPTPCTDNDGGTDVTVTSDPMWGGHKYDWTIQELDNSHESENPDSAEPNTGDEIQVAVPPAGAVLTNSLGCTITINDPPAGGPYNYFYVKGKYSDNGVWDVSLTNLPVTTSGGNCPLGAITTTSTFYAQYTFNPVIWDKS